MDDAQVLIGYDDFELVPWDQTNKLGMSSFTKFIGKRLGH